MKLIQQQFSAISDHWHKKGIPVSQTFGADAGAYAAYYTAMYLIQDTTEPIDAHIAIGFSTDPLTAYIEFFGVVQAVIIQQDAISELSKCLLGNSHAPPASSAWGRIREFRNQLVGHPANQGKLGKAKRSFFGRIQHSYEKFNYEQWDEATGQRSYPTVNLRAMITAYDNEAIPWPGHLVSMLAAEAFRAKGLEMPRAVVTSGSLPMHFAMLATGRFLGIYSKSVVLFGAQRLSLKILPVDLSAQSTPIGIMTSKNRTPNPLTKLFIDCAREVTKSFAAAR